jgi:uridine kinase
VRTVDDLVRLIDEQGRAKRLIVFVCGFGGAGKTTFCHELSSKLPCSALVFETDWYAKYATNERRERIKSAVASQDPKLVEQEENPKNWYDWTEVVSALSSLRETGHLALRNGWSQRTGEKELSIDLELPCNEASVILCDGIYLLHDEVRSVADLIVMLDTPIVDCLDRTAMRDSHRSSREYLEYKAALLEKYDKPYFEQFGKNAHVLASSQPEHTGGDIQVQQRSPV